MKLQLDTTAKTIKVEEDIKLSKLYSIIKKLLPNGEWQDFTLKTNTVIEHWSSPIILKEYYPAPQRPWWDSPWIQPVYYAGTNISQNEFSAVSMSTEGKMLANNTAMSKNVAYELKAGTFNIEI